MVKVSSHGIIESGGWERGVTFAAEIKGSPRSWPKHCRALRVTLPQRHSMVCSFSKPPLPGVHPGVAKEQNALLVAPVLLVCWRGDAHKKGIPVWPFAWDSKVQGMVGWGSGQEFQKVAFFPLFARPQKPLTWKLNFWDPITLPCLQSVSASGTVRELLFGIRPVLPSAVLPTLLLPSRHPIKPQKQQQQP